MGRVAAADWLPSVHAARTANVHPARTKIDERRLTGLRPGLPTDISFPPVLLADLRRSSPCRPRAIAGTDLSRSTPLPTTMRILRESALASDDDEAGSA